MATDLDRLRAENPLADVALGFGVNLQKNGNEWEACCPFHQEDTPSFTIFRGQDGVDRFHCFGCGERGDVMDFVKGIKGVDLKEAIRILGGEIRRDNVAPRRIAEPVDIYAGIVPRLPEGELKAGRRVKLWNPKRSKFGTITPSMVFPYRRTDGSVMGYVLRHDLDGGGKETPMVMWCDVPGQGLTWCRYPFPKPRPLYGLDRITAAPGKQVIIVEGEKCADVGAAITGRLVVTWAGGTYGINHADWSPLAGRSIVIWPDADGPGLKTAHSIASILSAQGCTIKIIDVTGKPKGWDIADAANDDGWHLQEIDAFMRANARVWVPSTVDGDDAGKGVSDDAAPSRGFPASDTSPPVISGEIAGGDFPAVEYEDTMAGWVPDYEASFLEPQMDKSDDLIEYQAGKRREVPASGRAKNGVPFRAWGGDEAAMREWVYLSGDDKFINMHTGQRMGVGSFDRTMSNICPIIETLNAKGETKNMKLPPSKTLLEFLDGVVCDTTMYRPDVDAALVWVDGILHLNSYLPASVPVTADEWQDHEAWQIARDHIHNIVPDGADLIIKWLAHNVQRPGRKIHWAPVIVGAQGDGKTTIGKILQMAMGRKNVSPVSPEALFSDFTSWAEGKCVRVLEEIRVMDKGRTSVMDKLKPMITNDVVDVVKKGKDGADVANVTNYIALTNHMDALAIDEGDRRWGVWRTRFKDRDQVRGEMGRSYWKRLNDAIGKHPEVIRAWLLSIDLSGFDPYDAPAMTLAKSQMIEASRSPISANIREAVALGGVGVRHDCIATDCLNDMLRAAGSRSVNTTELSRIMGEMGWVKHLLTVKWNGKTRRVYYLPGQWSAGLEGKDLSAELRLRLQATEGDQPEEQSNEAQQGSLLEPDQPW